MGVAIRAPDKLPCWGGWCWEWRWGGWGDWTGRGDGHPAGVGIESEGLDLQGLWKLWVRHRKGKGGSFRWEYSSQNSLLLCSGHTTKNVNCFSLYSLNSFPSNTIAGQKDCTGTWFSRIQAVQAASWLLKRSLRLYPGKGCEIWKCSTWGVGARKRVLLYVDIISEASPQLGKSHPQGPSFSFGLIPGSPSSLLGFVLSCSSTPVYLVSTVCQASFSSFITAIILLNSCKNSG